MNVFDIIGPVMIGPSSSHTAGAVRLGRVAYKILGEPAVCAEIQLSGSFAQTYRGHGTDKALVAGIMGMESDDERIRRSLDIAREEGLEFSFIAKDMPGTHPNTARIRLKGVNGASCEIQGASVGGGNILVTKINGMDVSFTGQYNTLLVLHYDKPGTIAAVTNYMAYSGMNIGNFRLSRPKKGGQAVMTIEVDGGVENDVLEILRVLPNVISVVLIRAI
jgi:L-serine dehydratase